MALSTGDLKIPIFHSDMEKNGGFFFFFSSKYQCIFEGKRNRLSVSLLHKAQLQHGAVHGEDRIQRLPVRAGKPQLSLRKLIAPAASLWDSSERSQKTHWALSGMTE